jgi:hypothetical protein
MTAEPAQSRPRLREEFPDPQTRASKKTPLDSLISLAPLRPDFLNSLSYNRTSMLPLAAGWERTPRRQKGGDMCGCRSSLMSPA